jgi:hypothetical protein
LEYSPAFPHREEQAGAEQGGSDQCACEGHFPWAPREETLIGLAPCDHGGSTVLAWRGVLVDARPGRLGAADRVSHQRPSRQRRDAVTVSGLRRGRGEYGHGEAESKPPEKANPSPMILQWFLYFSIVF